MKTVIEVLEKKIKDINKLLASRTAKGYWNDTRFDRFLKESQLALQILGGPASAGFSMSELQLFQVDYDKHLVAANVVKQSEDSTEFAVIGTHVTLKVA